VIEGGNAYAGGTAFKGIPGLHSVNELAGTVLTADSTSTSDDEIEADDLSDTIAARLVRDDGAPFFIQCTTGAATIKGSARKLSTYTAASNTYTTAAVFPSTPQDGDTFTIYEGFKRAPDNWDLDSDEVGTPAGFDRHFRLSFIPGQRYDHRGDCSHFYETVMELRVRFLRHGRDQLVIDSVVDNMARISSIITRQEHRDPGGLVQFLGAEDSESEVVTDDKDKIVMADRFKLIYRVPSAFL